MMKRIMAAVAALFIVSLTACGTITPPQAAVTTTETTTTTAATVPMMTTMTDDSSEPEVTKPGISAKPMQICRYPFLVSLACLPDHKKNIICRPKKLADITTKILDKKMRMLYNLYIRRIV